MIELQSTGNHAWIVRDGPLYLGRVVRKGRSWEAWRSRVYVGKGRLREDALTLLELAVHGA